MIKVRPISEGDLVYLMDIDLKASDYPYELDDWKLIGSVSNLECFIGTSQDTPVGFVLYERNDTRTIIHKLCVKPYYTEQGIGGKLITVVHNVAQMRDHDCIDLPIPENYCLDNLWLPTWLNKLGYLAKEIQNDFYSLTGEKIPAYIFRRMIYG